MHAGKREIKESEIETSFTRSRADPRSLKTIQVHSCTLNPYGGKDKFCCCDVRCWDTLAECMKKCPC